MNQSVLLLGADPRIVLTIARSLWRHSIPVIVAGTEGDANPRSRAIREFVSLPNPASEAFLPALTTIIERNEVGLLVPTGDTVLVAVRQHYQELIPRVTLACPPPEVVDLVIDKDKTLATATELGIPIPQTYSITNPRILEKLKATLRFPLIAKARSKRCLGPKALYLADAEAVERAFANYPSLRTNAVFQEYCPGEGVGVEILLHGGEPLAIFQHRRRKELPDTGGIAVMAVSEAVDPQLRDWSLQLLRHIGWTGPAMVEFRQDRTHDRAVLMEVNGRYWGSVATAVHSGVDFPFYHWQLLHGQLPQVPLSYRCGVRVRWISGEVRRLHGLLQLSSGGPRKTSFLRALARSIVDLNPRVRDMVFCLSDPAPGFIELAHTLKDLAAADIKAIARKLLPRSLLQLRHPYRNLTNAQRYICLKLQVALALGLRGRRLRRLLPKVRSVLFVCHGNIMRSPFAAALLQSRLPAGLRSELRIASAGLYAKPENSADERILQVANEFSIDLSWHRARRLSREDLQSCDLIFVMDFLNYVHLITEYPWAVARTFLFGELQSRPSAGSVEIADPYTGTIEDVRACSKRLLRMTDIFASSLASSCTSLLPDQTSLAGHTGTTPEAKRTS